MSKLAVLRGGGWPPLLWLALLLAAALGLAELDGLFRLIEPDRRTVIYARAAFIDLLGSHLLLVTLAACVSSLVGVGAAIMVTRRWGADFLPLVSQVASIGQTIPPVAVLALAVPALGFGSGPTLFALMLYGLLPILRNSLAGLRGIDPAVLEAARGMGMAPLQVLCQVELPLALNVILAGIRTSVTINIATAAIGSTIGASTLGDPVISGLVTGNTAFILQGAILIGLLAVAVDSLFEQLQRRAPGTRQAK
ncbi:MULTISPECIES: ABC transporter permease [Pseudomonas]|uniref:ABC transporter permease n=1 Tax=Pseudomonas TaxID=286 RepID=UPI0028F44A93|nr:ABC transporter permease [Pseudomonas tumuqii]